MAENCKKNYLNKLKTKTAQYWKLDIHLEVLKIALLN